MNKQYFEELRNRLQNDKQLTKTERNLLHAYEVAANYEFDWIGIDSADNVDAEELINVMNCADIHEVYITGGWSGQFENWYKLQEAGLKMLGIRLIDNPKYLHGIKKLGHSWNEKKQYVLVFELV